METKQTHFKMYKSGRKWVFACALVLVLGGTATVAHADTASSSEEPESSQVTTKTSSADTSETAATNDGATKGTTSGDNQSEGTTDDQNQPDLTTDSQDGSNQEEAANKLTTDDSDQTTGSEVTNEEQDKNTGDSAQVTNNDDSAKADHSDTTTNDEAPAKIQAESLKLADDSSADAGSTALADASTINPTDTPVTAQSTVATANDAVQDGGSVYDDLSPEYNILGIPSYFHIFANEATLNTHTNGNVAVGLLHGNVNFGTNVIEALLDKDISYIQAFDKLANSSFVVQGETRDNKIVFGDGVEIDISNPNRPKINGVDMDHLTANEVFQDKNGNVYIDFAAEFAKLKQTNTEVADWPSVKDYTSADFPDQNNRVIDVTNMTPDENGRIVLNLSPDVMTSGTPITIKGLSPDEDGHTVVINVDTNGQDDYTINSEVKIIYSDGTERENHETEYFGDNHLLWNFIDRTASDKQYTGTLSFERRFQGSVLAPSADVVVANVNLDGNIIADKVTVNGETHRWDLQDRPNPGKPELPENPDIPVTLPGEAPEPAPEPE
ncbi:collagen-binding domain-containing protein [Levilactobacillus namurensis]|uniref:Choice-of-anchor A family protein n=1 Tax=Levilactobacillus namurensis TaxID=380393 RepID=A0AAW8W2R2_9LACO|nr:collagen-binding domain-containing protein [Levilactobacillus namurensis]MDT7012998.1 choice-of-anchor A family protein [Levilactobacillus namurensis]